MCTVALALALALTAEPGFVSASPPTAEYDAPQPERAPSPVDATADVPSAADPSAGTIELVVDAPATAAAPSAPAQPDPAPAQPLPAAAPAELAAPPSADPGSAPVADAVQATPSTPPVAVPATSAPPASSTAQAADLRSPVAVAPGQKAEAAPGPREGEPPGVVLDASSRVDLVDARVVRAEAHVVLRVDAARKAPDGSSTQASGTDAPLVGGLLETVNRAFATVERVAAGSFDPADEPRPAKDERPAAAAAAPGMAAATPAAPATPPAASQTVNTTGQTVRIVRDPSGAVIELVLDARGNVLSARVVNPAPAAM